MARGIFRPGPRYEQRATLLRRHHRALAPLSFPSYNLTIGPVVFDLIAPGAAPALAASIGPAVFDLQAPGVSVSTLNPSTPAVELLVDFAGNGFTADTTETGSPARVAGQFEQFTSCAIRSPATADRVQIGALATATDFAFLIYLDPDYAYNDASQPAVGWALDWRASANERIGLFYTKATGLWSLVSVHGGVTQTLTLADTWAAGAGKVLYVAGSAGALYIGTGGGTITSAARTQIPTGLPATLDIGSQAGALQLEAAYACVVQCSAVLSQGEFALFAALERPPLFGETIGRVMVGLWYGAETWYFDDDRDIVTGIDALECERGRAGASTLNDRGQAGRLRATIDNADGRYSPANGASELAGLMLPARRVRFRMADSEYHYPIWAGYADDYVLDGGMPPTMTLEAVGIMARLAEKKISPAAQPASTTGAIIGAILDAASIAAADRVIDTGNTATTPWYVTAKNALEALRELEDTELGFLYEAKTGPIVFEQRHARLINAASTTAQAAYSDADGAMLPFETITPTSPLKQVSNEISVDVQGFTTQALAVLWTMGSALLPTIAGATGSVDVIAEYPVSGGEGAYVQDWTTPVLGTDITWTQYLIGGIYYPQTSEFTITNVEKLANLMRFTISRSGVSGVPTDFTLIQARGTGVVADAPTKLEASDATSQTTYGPRTYRLNAPWIENVNDAQGYLDYAIAKYKDPTYPIPQLVVGGNGSPGILRDALARDVSDRVSVVATGIRTQMALSGNYYIESIKYSLDPSRIVRAQLALSPVFESGTTWILGVSLLGVTTGLWY